MSGQTSEDKIVAATLAAGICSTFSNASGAFATPERLAARAVMLYRKCLEELAKAPTMPSGA